MALRDSYNRIIDYMRLSVTDRCNLRCIYCMPHEDDPFVFKEILTYEEIIRVVRIGAKLGLRKIRITGGEPLARKNIQYLIKKLKEIEGIQELSMTTNGVLLHQYAEELKQNGLDRINVSLDSLDPEKYSEITRGGQLERVLQGIKKAYSIGLRPLKINTVIIRGINDSEIERFAEFTIYSPYQVRFIEFMPGKDNSWSKEHMVSMDEIKERIEKNVAPVEPVRHKKSGPAEYYRLKGAKGLIGFISAITHRFCSNCNRLRLTADGKLRPCLFSERVIDLKKALRNGATDEEIERLLCQSVDIKPKGHNIGCDGSGSRIETSMSKIGG